MPVDGTLIFDTEIDRSGIEKGSKLAKSDLEKLGTQVKDIFSSKNLTSGLADLGGKLVGAFAFAKLAQGLGQVATAAIKYNAQMEAYQTNFSVMLGDEAKGVEYVAQLREKAAKTPFGMEDLASAAQTMLSFGMDAENANAAMDRLGDIALGNKDKFQSLSLAFSQISAAGKLTGEDLLQMVNAGFNPLNTLAEKTGTSLGDLKDVMSGGKGSAAFRKQMKDAQNEVKKLGAGASEGAKLLAQIGQEGMISAEMVGKAMEIETSPGGRFYDGMENASKTMEGQFSTLKDNSMQLVGNIFSPISDALSGVPRFSPHFFFYMRTHYWYPQTENDTRRLMNFFGMVKDKVTSNDIYRRELIIHLLRYLYLELFNAYEKEASLMTTRKDTRKEELANKFFGLIMKHFKENKDVAFYADKLCITSKYLTMVIKEVSGKSAKDWIVEYIVLEIKALLKNTNMNIQEIAVKTNFANQSSLGRFFRKHTGMSLSQYRMSNLG